MVHPSCQELLTIWNLGYIHGSAPRRREILKRCFGLLISFVPWQKQLPLKWCLPYACSISFSRVPRVPISCERNQHRPSWERFSWLGARAVHGGWAPDVRACSLSTPSCQMQTLHLGKIERFTAKVGNLKTMSFHQMGFGTHICSYSVGLPSGAWWFQAFELVLSEPIWLMLLLTSDPRKDLGRRPRWLEKNGASSGCQKRHFSFYQKHLPKASSWGEACWTWLPDMEGRLFDAAAWQSYWQSKSPGCAMPMPCQCQCQCPFAQEPRLRNTLPVSGTPAEANAMVIGYDRIL